MEFNSSEALGRIAEVVNAAHLQLYRLKVWYEPDGSKCFGKADGLRLKAHKNTWKRKRASSYLIRIEYFLDGQKILYHVEPWTSYPSDYLIAKLMLLPPTQGSPK